MKPAHEATPPKLSVVLPCYNEAEGLVSLHRRLADTLDSLRLTFEIIFVDDGSSDGTWAEIEAISRRDAHVRGIRFSRNFGHQAALLAGLEVSKGQAAVVMDSDGQHPPELIPQMVDRWLKGAEVVNTLREEVGGQSIFKRVSSALYYRFFTKLTGIRMRAGQADFRLMDRKVIDAVLTVRNRRPFFRGFVAWVGFRQEYLAYKPEIRLAGTSKYSLSRMLLLALDGSISFSYTPIRITAFLGLGMTLFSFAYGLYAIIVRLFLAESMENLAPGWASIASLLSFGFGVIFMQLGLIGEYVARLYIEGGVRPIYIVAEHLGPQVSDDENLKRLSTPVPSR